MRQPQASKSSFGSKVTRANTPAAIRLPSVTPIGAQLPNRPRLAAGAYSTAKITAPPYSAPAPNPCSRRSTTRITGAQMPI
jgi:hypothetical protein